MATTDEEFMEAWMRGECSPAKVARILNIDVRNVYKRRGNLSQKGVVLPTTVRKQSDNPYGQTWSYKREREGYVENGHVIVYSDAHFWPGERTVANEALLLLLKELKPKRVIANGDIFDGARVSRHDPHGWGQPPSVREELDACRDRQHEIVMAAPKGCEFDWNIGNHDMRFDKTLAIHAGQYDGVIERLCDHFPEWNMAWSIRLNRNVMIKHRWHNGIHATYNNALKGGLTIVTGHLHRLAVTPWANYTGRIWGVDSGTLSDPLGPQFEYLENNSTPWCSGFAVLTFKDGMILPPELCEVIEGHAYFRGKLVV